MTEEELKTSFACQIEVIFLEGMKLTFLWERLACLPNFFLGCQDHRLTLKKVRRETRSAWFTTPKSKLKKLEK